MGSLHDNAGQSHTLSNHATTTKQRAYSPSAALSSPKRTGRMLLARYAWSIHTTRFSSCAPPMKRAAVPICAGQAFATPIAWTSSRRHMQKPLQPLLAYFLHEPLSVLTLRSSSVLSAEVRSRDGPWWSPRGSTSTVRRGAACRRTVPSRGRSRS